MGIADDLQGLARRLVEPLRGYLVPWDAIQWQDYTPDLYGSTTPGSTTWQAGYPVGRYLRLGNLVAVNATLVWTNDTGTGNMRVQLPFTAAQDAVASVFCQNLTYAGDGVQGLVLAGANYMRFFSPATGGGGTELAMDTAATLRFSVVYEV